MKVTLLSTSFARKTAGYGDVLQMTRLEKGLKLIGVDAEYIPLVGVRDTPVICEKADTCTMSCLYCDAARPQMPGCYERLIRIALRRDADVLHVRGAELMDGLSGEGRLPIVYTGHPHAHFDKNTPKSVDIERFEKADALVFLNKGMQNFVNETYGVSSQLIPVAADTDLFKPSNHVKGDTVTIGYIGSLQHYQGVNMLMQTVPALNARGVNARLRACINKPEGAEKMVKAAKLLGIGHLIHVKSDIPNHQIPIEISDCDIMHLVRDFDKECHLTPIKLLDYMAMEKPIIYSKGDAGITEMWADAACEVGESTMEFIHGYVKNARNFPNSTGMRQKLFDEKRDLRGAAQLAEKVYAGVL